MMAQIISSPWSAFCLAPDSDSKDNIIDLEDSGADVAESNEMKSEEASSPIKIEPEENNNKMEELTTDGTAKDVENEKQKDETKGWNFQRFFLFAWLVFA
jgi:hypothetical protein